MHRIGEPHVKCATLAFRLLFVSFEESAKVGRFALEFGEYLKTIVMVAHILLVDDQNGQQKVKYVAHKQRGPIVQLFDEAFVEDLMQKEEYFAVEEDAVDLLVGDGRFRAGRRHLEGPQKVGHEYFEL